MVVGVLGQTMGPAAKTVGEAPRPEPGKHQNLLLQLANIANISNIIRSCTSPTPSCGGTTCAGSSSQDTTCNTQCCGINQNFAILAAKGSFNFNFKFVTVVGALGLTRSLIALQQHFCSAKKPAQKASRPNTGGCAFSYKLKLTIRSCTRPSPSCGGTDCAGSSSKDVSCNTECCGIYPLLQIWQFF